MGFSQRIRNESLFNENLPYFYQKLRWYCDKNFPFERLDVNFQYIYKFMPFSYIVQDSYRKKIVPVLYSDNKRCFRI